MVKAALIQLNSGDDPAENLPAIRGAVRAAAEGGADFVLTPEVSNCVSVSRKRQADVLVEEAQDRTLAELQKEALTLGIWLLLGSLALRSPAPETRFANRSFLISPKGKIAARYDKIHMFDVDISETESYRESAGYRPGDRAVLAQTPFATLGLTICYDLRFPALYRRLAQAGAQILTVPSAFSPVSGAAHWESLLRARAIETGAFVLAPAQTGDHGGRRTHGHSLAVSPWGEVLADGGTDPGITFVDLNMEDVAQSRGRIPSLTHDRPFDGP